MEHPIPLRAVDHDGRGVTFTRKLDNRPQMPTRHVLIVEDNIGWQIEALKLFQRIYGPDNFVQCSVCCGGQPASSFLSYQSAGLDLVLLDHDMPMGDGVEFLKWFRKGFPLDAKPHPIPVITYSGIEENNATLCDAGATHRGSKEALASGQLDGLITGLLRLTL